MTTNIYFGCALLLFFVSVVTGSVPLALQGLGMAIMAAATLIKEKN